jgi:hypothetical protein
MGLVRPFHLVVLGQEAERTVASLPNRVLVDLPPPNGLFFGLSACRRPCQLAFTPFGSSSPLQTKLVLFSGASSQTGSSRRLTVSDDLLSRYEPMGCSITPRTGQGEP